MFLDIRSYDYGPRMILTQLMIISNIAGIMSLDYRIWFNPGNNDGDSEDGLFPLGFNGATSRNKEIRYRNWIDDIERDKINPLDGRL